VVTAEQPAVTATNAGVAIVDPEFDRAGGHEERRPRPFIASSLKGRGRSTSLLVLFNRRPRPLGALGSASVSWIGPSGPTAQRP
jgi:hypothetical protein